MTIWILSRVISWNICDRDNWWLIYIMLFVLCFMLNLESWSKQLRLFAFARFAQVPLISAYSNMYHFLMNLEYMNSLLTTTIVFAILIASRGYIELFQTRWRRWQMIKRLIIHSFFKGICMWCCFFPTCELYDKNYWKLIITCIG